MDDSINMSIEEIRLINELYAATPSGEGRVGMQRAFCIGRSIGIKQVKENSIAMESVQPSKVQQ